MSDVVRAAALRGFSSVIAECGGDLAALLARVGIEPALLDSEDAVISHHSLVRLLEHASAELKVPDIGLRVAEHQDISILGPLAVVMLHSATLREAVESASRFMFVHSPAVSFTLTDDPDGSPDVVGLRYSLNSPPPTRQVVEMALLVAHRVGRLDIGAAAGPIGVDFPHSRLSPPERYAECFGAPVRFGRPTATLRLPAEGLALSMTAANPLLRQLALDYLTVRYPDPHQAYVPRVRGYLDQALGNGAIELAAVAATFGIHARTLQRRLVAEGTSYAQILDAARRDAALRHLIDSDLALSRVTTAVGLAEQSALTRCCLRWFGATPSAVRRAGGVDDAVVQR
ncbi:AraC family transcriptional regulator [Nocardia aurantiaca]|uniref:Helix-turn-helix domain-containing protein n=1 Tax=Nocardia aurantiaca TaxID=2675850 RepID=A0A6I3KWZ4_9NOCA|nr:AraC family transcriptional regulator [Nocardia aurantiaca]MTE12604.1 helix-turn-helix domain-containing protein [Nocardia aurantiaca]